jgi:hypothetical protein
MEAWIPMRTDDKIRKRIELELARVNQAIEILKKEPRAEELEGLGDNTRFPRRSMR